MLKPGDPAPDWTGLDDTGTERSLREFRGQRVVLWFYPKADTPGCTAEGQGLRDRAPQFDAMNVAILGASFDEPAANRRFREKFDFPFPLLSDTTRELGMGCGACTDPQAKAAARITVVIGADGRVERVYPKVDPKTHAEELLHDLAASAGA